MQILKKNFNNQLIGLLFAITILSTPFTAYAMQGGLLYVDDDLRQAIADNSPENVKIALTLGANAKEGLMTALKFAETDGDTLDAIINALGKDDLDAIGDGGTALHLAAQKGNITAAEKLVQKGVNLEVLDGAAQTPLLHAIYYRQMGMVQWLVEHGANIDVKVFVERVKFNAVSWTEQLAKTDNNYNAIFNYLSAFRASQDTNRFEKPITRKSGINDIVIPKADGGLKPPTLSSDTSSLVKPLLFGLLGIVTASFLYKIYKSTRVSYKR